MDMNTDLKLDTLSFVYYFCYLHYDLLLVSLLRLHAICVFYLIISQTRENIYANPKYLRYTQHIYLDVAVG